MEPFRGHNAVEWRPDACFVQVKFRRGETATGLLQRGRGVITLKAGGIEVLLGGEAVSYGEKGRLELPNHLLCLKKLHLQIKD